MSPLKVALRRIGALARRDATIQLTYHFQLALRVVGMFTTVVVFFFLGKLVGSSEALEQYQGGYFEFALVGVIMGGLAMTCITTFGQNIQDAQTNGTLEVLLATSTSLPTLMAGMLVVPLALAGVDTLVYLGLGALLAGGLDLPPSGLLLALPLLVLTLGTFCALGILSATVIVLTKRGDPFSSLALQATNILAGAVFPVALLPEPFQILARLIPAFYGLHGIREVLLGGGGAGDVRGDLVALLIFNAVLLPLSLWALRGAIRVAKVTGTLGNR